MNKITGACFLLLAVLLLVHYGSAGHTKPDEKLARIDSVNGEMMKPLENILGELEGLRVRRAAQGGGNGGQGGQGNGGRRGPPDGGQGQRGGQGGQGSGEN